MTALSVLMTTEGTYPYGSGGVSTWCDAILRNTPDVSYTLVPLMMNPHIDRRYLPPKNVRRIIDVPLWGTEEPAEFISGLIFRDVYDRKTRTENATIEREFLPLFEQLLRFINTQGSEAHAIGEVFVAMENYFRRRDYNETLKSQPVWDLFRSTMERTGSDGPAAYDARRRPTLFDLTECLRWLYRFLIVLNVRTPRTSVTHSTAAAFCGIPCITSKVRYGTPMILTEHGVYLREQNLFLSRFRKLVFSKEFLLKLITAIVRANYQYADVIAPVCHYNTRWELAHGAPQTRIRVIYNGVDPEHFSPPAEEPHEPLILTTARIDRLKDIETLLRAAHLVHQTHADARFAILGSVADQEYFAHCLALRRELGLDSVVEMGHATEHVARELKKARIVLLTSISEAFPYSLVEAMACGRPVVASDVGGVSEALEGCGVLVKPRDVDGFAAAVRTLLDDRALRQRLSRKARERVLEEFRLDGCVSSYLDLYRTLGGQRSAA